MAQKLGYCKACNELVSKTFENKIFGRKPRFAIVNNMIFHRSCWIDYKKAIESKRSLGIQAGTSGINFNYSEDRY